MRPLGIKALNGTTAATTQDAARAAYIRLLGSLGSNARYTELSPTRFKNFWRE